MNSNENVKYFDLHTTGIGYLNRVREVTPEEGTPFLAVTIAAIHGSVTDVQPELPHTLPGHAPVRAASTPV